MSQQLINHSPDLKQLRDEGYELEVRANHLLVKSIPYVNSKKEIQLGVLVSTLRLAGDKTTTPDTHVVYFIGETPCKADGSALTAVINSSRQTSLSKDLIAQHTFSSKPKGGYKNYYEKMKTYSDMLISHAQAIDPTATPLIFPVYEPTEDESVFNYSDTASSRAGINVISQKLAIDSIAIVGTGGTGSYVLDLVAKTPVKNIHLFDGDTFLSHNAFRTPGAATIDELRLQSSKVDYLQRQYSAMRRNIFAHNIYVDASNIDLLSEMNFVFLCLDSGDAKKLLVEKLEEIDVPFVDVGMGVQQIDESLIGVLRVTSSTVKKREHIREMDRISFADSGGNNDYETNIQVADLNALNAALAVIKWKKIFGFYADPEQEHHSTYTIDGNTLTNEDRP